MGQKNLHLRSQNLLNLNEHLQLGTRRPFNKKTFSKLRQQTFQMFYSGVFSPRKEISLYATEKEENATCRPLTAAFEEACQCCCVTLTKIQSVITVELSCLKVVSIF